MTITAKGAVIDVVLNGTEVSTIDLDDWTVPGKRPDGQPITDSRTSRSPSCLAAAIIGFQDLGGDCWFKDIDLTTPAHGPAREGRPDARELPIRSPSSRWAGSPGMAIPTSTTSIPCATGRRC